MDILNVFILYLILYSLRVSELGNKKNTMETKPLGLFFFGGGGRIFRPTKEFVSFSIRLADERRRRKRGKRCCQDTPKNVLRRRRRLLFLYFFLLFGVSYSWPRSTGGRNERNEKHRRVSNEPKFLRSTIAFKCVLVNDPPTHPNLP